LREVSETLSEFVIKRFREGNLLAEVEVQLLTESDSWGPSLSLEDARKLERVRVALKNGDAAVASLDAKVFEVTAFAAE
jgi:hypothetical protein